MKKITIGITLGIAMFLTLAMVTYQGGMNITHFGGEPVLSSENNAQTAPWINFTSNGVPVFQVLANGTIPGINGGGTTYTNTANSYAGVVVGSSIGTNYPNVTSDGNVTYTVTNGTYDATNNSTHADLNRDANMNLTTSGNLTAAQFIGTGTGNEFIGNGRGLTNQPFVKTMSVTGGSVAFTVNSDGSTNAAVTVTGGNSATTLMCVIPGENIWGTTSGGYSSVPPSGEITVPGNSGDDIKYGMINSAATCTVTNIVLGGTLNANNGLIGASTNLTCQAFTNSPQGTSFSAATGVITLTGGSSMLQTNSTQSFSWASGAMMVWRVTQNANTGGVFVFNIFISCTKSP